MCKIVIQWEQQRFYPVFPKKRFTLCKTQMPTLLILSIFTIRDGILLILFVCFHTFDAGVLLFNCDT